VNGLDLHGLLAVAQRAARVGGETVAAGFGAVHEAQSKAPGDWVSAVDTNSERLVRAVLLEGAPDIPVHGEEEGGERADVEWLVDPLDGTANCMERGTPFALSHRFLQTGPFRPGNLEKRAPGLVFAGSASEYDRSQTESLFA